MKRITIMTIKITFGGEGTPDPPLMERAHQTLPSWRGHTRPSPRGEGTPDPPLVERAHQTLPSWRGHTRSSPHGEGTPDSPFMERAHQTLPSWRGHTRPSPPGEAHQTLQAHQTIPWGRHTRPSWGGHTRPSPHGEGTPDPPLQGRHTTLSPGEGTSDLLGEGTPDPPGAHQTLGEGTSDPPHSRQTVYSRGRCQAAPIAPIRGQVFVHPQQTQGVYVDQHLP